MTRSTSTAAPGSTPTDVWSRRRPPRHALDAVADGSRSIPPAAPAPSTSTPPATRQRRTPVADRHAPVAHWEAAARQGAGRRARDARPPAETRRRAPAGLVRPARRPHPAHRRPAPRRASATSGTSVFTYSRDGRTSRRRAAQPPGRRSPPPGARSARPPRRKRPHDPRRTDRRRRLPRPRRLRRRRARCLRRDRRRRRATSLAGTEAQLRAAARACPAGAILLFDAATGEEVDP